MRTAGFVTIAVVVGLSGPAFAQTGSGQQSAANPPVGQATTNPSSDNPRGWMASGFIGTNFGSGRSTSVNLTAIEDLNTNNSTSVNFGGQVGYLARGVIGAEFLADFSPGFGIFDNALFQQSPDVNSYMFNLIAVAPFGHAQSYDPYVSGGIGAVTLDSTIFVTDPTRTPLAALATQTASGSKFGWNIGGGVMAWSEKNWGFRGDLRYYATNSHNADIVDLDLNHIDTVEFTRLELSGIRYWKANAGIAFRW